MVAALYIKYAAGIYIFRCFLCLHVILQRKAELDGQTVQSYKALQALGTDINQYVLSQNAQPSKIIEVINSSSSNFHLHHS